jgi:predicted RNase H-like nuclease
MLDLHTVSRAVGIDVGGVKKGYHAVLHINQRYHAHFHSTDPYALAEWAQQFEPNVIAIDAPSMFSLKGGSRTGERDLVKNGMRCFYTPTRAAAEKSRFYDWVFNGERLYQALAMPHFDGHSFAQACLIETFPHGIETAYRQSQTQVKPSGNKLTRRLSALANITAYDTQHLTNIDFIDAALCAVAADHCLADRISIYGCSEDGFIIIPRFC